MHQRNLFLSLWPTSLIVGLATLGPVGLLKAPGTWGSVAGIGLVTILFAWLHPAVYLLLAAGMAYLAVLICGEAEIRLAQRDPGKIVLDEFVAVPFCFIGIFPAAAGESGWLWLLAGFGLFRFFDILKPLGIDRLQRYPSGLGVVLDDLGAALATCVLLNLAMIIL